MEQTESEKFYYKQEEVDENYPFVIAKLADSLNTLKQKHKRNLDDAEKSYKEQLKLAEDNCYKRLIEAERTKKQELANLEHQFKNSLTWRIGSFPLNIIKYIRNFLYNPIRFIKDSKYRSKDVALRPKKRHIILSRNVDLNYKSKGSLHDRNTLSEIDENKITLIGILDTFTLSCFKPEFNIIAPSPESWQEVLKLYSIQGLFFESAWHGNDDTWQYQIGKYNNEDNKKLKEIIAGIKKKNLPTIFWNKEDPVHYDHFMEAAKMADFVFTTDSDCIPGYREQVGHNNVFAMPFAAQEKIHNPIRTSPRKGLICFAGTYHTKRYSERKNDMDVILKPALGFGLEIYDRNFGVQGKAAENYKFPEIYQSSIKGKLEYKEMVEAYKQYKVFLNVNSVRNSPTMFSRRVYELLACGTPVISTYSKGIVDMLGDDTVFIAKSEADTRKYLEQLLNNEEFWWQKSLSGMRKVLENHTYYHRTQEIFKQVGLEQMKSEPASFLIISEVSNKEDVNYLRSILKHQTYDNFEILLILNCEDTINDLDQDKLIKLFYGKRVNSILKDDIDNKSEIMLSFNYTHVAVFKLDNYYGKNYLRDYALAVKYSGASKIGKKSYFSAKNDNTLILHNKDCEFTFMADVPAGTLVIEKNVIKADSIKSLFTRDSYYDFSINILSIDPFNFILYGRYSQQNIWQKTDI